MPCLAKPRTRSADRPAHRRDPRAEALLILDNCEHVIGVRGGGITCAPGARGMPAAAHPGDEQGNRLQASPERRCGVVEPLALPEEDAGSADIESSPAVQLLRGPGRRGAQGPSPPTQARWRRWRASAGRLTGCRWRSSWLLAARLRTMSIDQLGSRHDDRFRLLTSGSRNRAAAAQDAARDGRLELGAAHRRRARMVLRRLSVFSGGASLEAAGTGLVRRLTRSSRIRCSTCSPR